MNREAHCLSCKVQVVYREETTVWVKSRRAWRLISKGHCTRCGNRVGRILKARSLMEGPGLESGDVVARRIAE